MKIDFSKGFVRDYRKLPQRIQKTADKQLDLLLSNPQHPSLNLKTVKGVKDIWEARITYHYRFTFEIEKDAYILRRIGTHAIYKNP